MEDKAKKTVNYIVFDFETGGLDCEKNPITQVGLIVLDGATLQEKERYSTYVQNYNSLDYVQKALDYTGTTMDDINKGKLLPEVVEDMKQIFLRSVEGKGKFKRKPIMVGHNIDAFDMDFLDYIFDACSEDISKYISRTTKDTMWMAFDCWQEEGIDKYNLQVCCERAKVDLIGAHDAMNDVEATVGLFKFFLNRMRGGSGSDFLEESTRFRETFKF